MKQVALKIFTIDLPNGETKDTGTLQLIDDCLDNMPERGFTYRDFQKRRRISDEIEKQKKEVEKTDGNFLFLILEDSDFDELKNTVQNMRWGIRSPHIEDFIKQFL